MGSGKTRNAQSKKLNSQPETVWTALSVKARNAQSEKRGMCGLYTRGMRRV